MNFKSAIRRVVGGDSTLARVCHQPFYRPVFKLTNRCHVVVRLFSNRSQMTSKCEWLKQRVCHWCFYLHSCLCTLIHHFHLDHNVPWPPPTPRKKLCSISWGDFDTQKKLKTMMMQNLGRGGGAGGWGEQGALWCMWKCDRGQRPVTARVISTTLYRIIHTWLRWKNNKWIIHPWICCFITLILWLKWE